MSRSTVRGIDLAATIEGHPDNSTPAILGGFCVALLENGHVHHVRVPVHGAIDFVVFIPDFQLSTEKARAALPKTIDHHDAVYNLARAALLAGSLTTGKLENLDAATGDCLHQPYRFGLIENGEDIVREAKKLARSARSFPAQARPSWLSSTRATATTSPVHRSCARSSIRTGRPCSCAVMRLVRP